ncbi:PAS domain S-box protein [Frigidibacter sp. MR17.24]|uniref:PAS domain S-box protein n=1 Tax=Frigidibacter sp. MR17.24 TaxID=3127345 RepID=UPI0030131AFF
MVLTCAVVAFLYLLAGWIAEIVASPVGHATIVWPAAGVALAAVLLRGPGVWPGVWLGSFLSGCLVTGALDGGVHVDRMIAPALIAGGAALQAALVGGLARARYGRPVRLDNGVEALTFLTFLGPMGTLISATIGTMVLFARGLLHGIDAVADTWWTWWTGDLLGIAVVVPLVLFSGWGRSGARLLWRGRQVPAMTNGSLVCVILCIGCSFWAWSALTRAQHENSAADFDAQAREATRLIESRLASYGGFVDGGAALVGAARGEIDAADWARLVGVLNVPRAAPGVLGLGFIEPVRDADLAAYAARSLDVTGAPLDIHPPVERDLHFIIRHLEPHERNAPALGLDLAAFPIERAALESASRRGLATMSAPIRLVQDGTGSTSVAILRAVYPPGVAAAADRGAGEVLGWVYTPIRLDDFLGDIAGASGAGYRLRVYDGPRAETGALIFDSAPGTIERNELYRVERPFRTFARDWTIRFESTDAFLAGHALIEPRVLLAAGLLLSIAVGTLMTLLLRREHEVRSLVDAKTRALETQQGHTRSIIETAMVGIVLIDHRGRMLSLNSAAERIFALPAHDLAGKRLADLLPIDLPGPRDAGAGQSAQIPMRRSDGSLRQIEVQVNLWQDAAGDSRGTAILRDITQRYRAEAQLRENERRLAMAMTGAQIAVFDIDLRDGSEVVSDNWATLMGFPPDTRVEDLDARAEFEARVLPEDRHIVHQADRGCIEGFTDRSICEYRVLAADGSIRWMRSEAMVSERDMDGTATRFLGVQTDVTRLRHALDMIRAKETQFRQVIENAPTGMALLDEECHLLRVNEAFCRFTGYGEGALLDRRLGDLIPPGGLIISEAERARLRSGEVPVVQMEREFARADGTGVWGLLNISAMGSSGSDGVAFIVQVQDITERRKVEQLKSDFVATVSHELRTPLTSIKGALGLVLGTMGRELPAKAERLLSIGQKNCDRLIMLVNDILDLEKLNSGKMRFDMVETSLTGLMEQAVAVNQPYADEHGVTIALRGAVPAGAVRVDRDRFGQVMSNLLSNAAKFSPRGTEVTLSAGPGATPDSVEIRVRDRGPGIPDEFRARMFTPFSQADSSATREKGGTGLGLNITHQILSQMEGGIDFANQPDGGCEFRVTLPLVAQAEPAAEAGGPAAAAAADAEVPAILHVEDDADFAEVFRSAFGERARVETAGSIAEARRALALGEYDLVVIDWALSDGDGRVLLDEIDTAVPIFGLSASEPGASDGRVQRQAVKSRSRLDMLVADCLAAMA